MEMNRTWNLKLFLSLSLGLHLSAFSFLCIFIPDVKIVKEPLRNMEVSLLSLTKGEKEFFEKREDKRNVRTPEFRIPSREEESLKTVEKNEGEVKSELVSVSMEEKKIPPVEPIATLEIPPSKVAQEPVIPVMPLYAQNVQTEVKKGSDSEPKPSLLENEKKEVDGKQAEKVVLASLGVTLPQMSSSETPSVALKSPSLMEKEILFTQPRYAENPKPLYPREAKKKGYEGEVLLRVEVLPDGGVGEIEVRRSSGHPILDRSAISAVKQWKFIPAKKGETPVTVRVNIPIAFQLR